MGRSLYTGSQPLRRSFERILLIKPSSLGDIVHALPVLHGLRVRFPHSVIDWLVASTYAPLLQGHPELNDVVLFDRRRFGRMAGSARVAADFLRFTRHLRHREYDLVIDLQGLFRTGFLALVTRAAVRIGFRSAREGAWMFYSHYLPVHEPDMHAVDRNYSVASLLDFEECPVEFNLALPHSLRDDTVHWLRDMGVNDGSRVVAIAPGARWETKVWGPLRFSETIDALHQRGQVRCLLLGAAEDIPLCERITAACTSSPINLAGRTDLCRLATVIRLADVVLCHDSAAMHLAVALQRPLVCLVGPTNPRRTGPYRRLDDVLSLELDCAPCYLRRLSQCPNNHQCMEELTSTMVVSAVERLVSRIPLAQTKL
ncbi:MAG: lipopolysaccharide heptosyltransferase II [Phycisphaerae bacterium]